MYVELPVCKRCCFCVPLRYGLIIWGYLKLIISSLLLLALIIEWRDVIRQYKRHNLLRPVILASIASVIILTDVLMSLIFIVGCHLKKVKLLRSYYFYGQIFLLLMIIYDTYYTVNKFVYIIPYTRRYNAYLYELLELFVFFTDIIIQIYILLILRSEIIKLKNGVQFKFSNLAAEAQCTLETEDSNEQATQVEESKYDYVVYDEEIRSN